MDESILTQLETMLATRKILLTRVLNGQTVRTQ
jgi:hypothetical protein